MAVLPLASCAAAATLVLLILLRRRRAANAAAAMVYELKGDYYQMLGHAWDHEVKDFKVVYRPLYHCVAGCHRFEAHHLAVSHFSRWERFRRLDPDEVNSLPPAVLSRLLPGPFWFDPDWDYDALTTPVPTSRSGLGHRSHERGRLEDLIGDYRGFISAVDGRLRRAGCAARARDYMLDHICYRVESVREYQQTLAALVPAFGTILVTSMIGGRPISIIRLKHPIEHCGYTVACLELPCPKPGRFYAKGLEHAELVVGAADAGVRGNAALLAWLAQCRAAALPLLDLLEPKQAIDKAIRKNKEAMMRKARARRSARSRAASGF